MADNDKPKPPDGPAVGQNDAAAERSALAPIARRVCYVCTRDLDAPGTRPIARAGASLGLSVPVVEACGPACAQNPRFTERHGYERRP